MRDAVRHCGQDKQRISDVTIVAYATSWERIGEARGEARGILKEKRVILERLVSKKFGVTAEERLTWETRDAPGGTVTVVGG